MLTKSKYITGIYMGSVINGYVFFSNPLTSTYLHGFRLLQAYIYVFRLQETDVSAQLYLS